MNCSLSFTRQLFAALFLQPAAELSPAEITLYVVRQQF